MHDFMIIIVEEQHQFFNLVHVVFERTLVTRLQIEGKLLIKINYAFDKDQAIRFKI